MDTNLKALDETLRQAQGLMMLEIADMVYEYGNPYEEDSAYYRDYLGIDQEDIGVLAGDGARISEVLDLNHDRPVCYAAAGEPGGDIEMVTLLGVFAVVRDGVMDYWMTYTKRNVMVADDDGMVYTGLVYPMGFNHVRSVYRLLKQVCTPDTAARTMA